MKYIYYIIGIFAALSLIIGYELFKTPAAPKDAALIINDRVITYDEFNRLFSSQPPHMRDKDEFINSLITKELMIQESQKTGIDREESFRKSIQNFYEQSLIKLLMDRKFAAPDIGVSDDELNRYISFMNKKLHLTIFTFDNDEKAGKGDHSARESRTIYFEDLCREIRNNVISLREGESTKPFRYGETYIAVRLEKIEQAPAQAVTIAEREKIKKMLAEEKKEHTVNDWISGLREKATVKIMVNGNH
ncbi:MAG: hypothetical protein HZA17_06245 [Nitrospirae bacterium]|nr:hypothetical protein [Nitrospirota bacterium]